MPTNRTLITTGDLTYRHGITRRSLMLGPAAGACARVDLPAIRLEIGNYGMQALDVDRAVSLIREIGYDGAELCCLPDWPSEPKRLDAAARRRIRESGFPIPTLLEAFNLLAPAEVLRRVPDCIRAAAELSHDLSPSNPPVLQTVLGGRPGEWEKVRDVMAARLAEWARAAGENRIRLAVKAHAMHTVDTPGKLVWLLAKVNHPALTGIYDYGHFQLAALGIEESMDALLSRSAFLTLKDSKLENGKPRFLLPGDGNIDYTRYFRKVKEMRWQGWALVEVTRQLQTQAGYDPARAARRSYAHLAPVLKTLGLR
jgi:sugar phosphate isomerase/epimerase